MNFMMVLLRVIEFALIAFVVGYIVVQIVGVVKWNKTHPKKKKDEQPEIVIVEKDKEENNK